MLLKLSTEVEYQLWYNFGIMASINPNNKHCVIDSVIYSHKCFVCLGYQATASHLCITVLDVISSVYHQDNANYFILEPHHTLSQFAEKIHLKPKDVQVYMLFQ